MAHDLKRLPSVPGTRQLADPVGETCHQIDDLNLRIVRQQRRVEKIILERHGPREELEAQLNSMIKARDLMQKQLDSYVKPREGRTDDLWPAVDATSPSKG